MKLVKRLVIGIAALTGIAFAASTYTTHYNLEKAADGDENWGNGYRSNLDTIDTQMFTSATGLSDHIDDTTGAHAATAISTTAGSACNTSTNAQSFLSCLDAQVDALSGGGGGVVTLENPQTITGEKTFSTTPIFSDLSTGILHSDSSGNLSSSLVTNSDVSASAAIADTKLDTISTSGKVSNSATTATNANTASAIVARDGSGNFSAGTITAALTGNASTATALAANPTDCGAGTKATAIDASGNLTCSAVSMTADISGIAPVANGGTGLSSLGSANTLLGVNSGASALEYKAVTSIGGIATTSSTGNERVERALVSTVCTASPCTIAKQSGSWLTSITRAGTGDYTANFAVAFSDTPTCVCTVAGGPISCVPFSESTTSVRIQAYTNTAVLADSSIRLICVGPR